MRPYIIHLLVLFVIIGPTSGAAFGSFTVENIGTDGTSPVQGRPLRVRCLIRSDNGSGPDLVVVRSGNVSSTMYPKVGTINWTIGAVYEGTLRLDDPGDRTIIITVKGGATTVTFIYNITVKEDGPGPKKTTILGLPRWYCALSVVFLTIFIMFITFAYFKGRTLQRARRAQDDQTYEFCSSCGARTLSQDMVCPSCKKDLVDSIEVCGKCRSKVPKGSSTCPSCGVRLAIHLE